MEIHRVMYKLTLEIPDDIAEDMEKRKRNHEGTYRDFFLRAYRATFNLPVPEDDENGGSK